MATESFFYLFLWVLIFVADLALKAYHSLKNQLPAHLFFIRKCCIYKVKSLY